MFIRKRDPGRCPVDDTPHTTCCAPTADTIVVVQFPARDGLTTPPLVGGMTDPPPTGAVPTAPLLAEQIQATLPAGQVTTGTYRGKRRR